MALQDKLVRLQQNVLVIPQGKTLWLSEDVDRENPVLLEGINEE